MATSMAQAKNAEIWIIIVIVIHGLFFCCCKTCVLLCWDINAFTVSKISFHSEIISTMAIHSLSCLQHKSLCPSFHLHSQDLYAPSFTDELYITHTWNRVQLFWQNTHNIYWIFCSSPISQWRCMQCIYFSNAGALLNKCLKVYQYAFPISGSTTMQTNPIVICLICLCIAF